MERWERSTYRHGREAAAEASKNPSFSSSLLDAIYRSIDEGDGVGNNDDTGRPTNRARNQSGGEKTDFSSTRKRFTTTTTDTKKFTNATTTAVSEKVLLCRRDYGGITEYGRGREAYWQQRQQRERHVLNSTSSSSESSYGGFSSSEAESVRMKPAKTTSRPPPVMEMRKPKQESSSSSSNSIKNRFRASKIYSELKKAKTPASPGGRLASFINQLFTSSGGHLKNVKTSSPAMTATGGDESTCSSASSYSRSCLSKTPSSSRSKASNGGAKRSVRFYPVSVVVGDDLRTCGQKCVYEDYSYVYDRFDLASLPPLPPVRVKDPALKGRKERKRGDLGLGFEDVDEEEEEEDDDAASYSSSDLFELENLTAVGGDELPVYETTHLHTNRAIAQGLIL